MTNHNRLESKRSQNSNPLQKASQDRLKMSRSLPIKMIVGRIMSDFTSFFKIKKDSVKKGLFSSHSPPGVLQISDHKYDNLAAKPISIN